MKHANIAFFVPMVGCPHRCSFCDQNSITGEAGVPTPSEVDETLKRAARIHLINVLSNRNIFL